ncbi:MAG: AMP-binding protein [Erythrobacter sp.]
MSWQGTNFGVALKALAQEIEADRPALIHGDRVVSWSELDAVTDRIAAGLRKRGFKPGDIAGQMLRNSPDYMLAYFGCIKAGLSPINVNYHYKDRELRDIFHRFELKLVFVESDFAEIAAAALPTDAAIMDVGSAAWADLQGTELPNEFSIHDDPGALFLTATGGTTGMPKAVMWPFNEAWGAFSLSTWPRGFDQPPFVTTSLEEHAQEAGRIGLDHPLSGSPMLTLSPLMHGAGQFTSVLHLLKGGTVALLPSAKFDADLAIAEAARIGAKTLLFVGDAFAIPLLDRIEARPNGTQEIASVRVIYSSGAVFSSANKDRFLAHNAQMAIIDSLGSSEGSGAALIITTAAGSTGGGKFQAIPGRETKLFDEALEEVPMGSDRVGIVARTGPLPLGYLGDEAKSAETFPTIDGKRWLMTGDRARWAADGSLEFIGRDNMCINTGGEKVFPEEVEAVLVGHGEVHDARVVSLPDARFGRKVVAVIQPEMGGSLTQSDLETVLDSYTRKHLAGYKIPRQYVFTQQTLRLNNGKADYKSAQSLADQAAS